MKYILLTTLLFTNTLVQASSIRENLFNIDKGFHTLEVITAECAFAVKLKQKDPSTLEGCKKLYALEKEEIQKVKNGYKKELNRYTYRKEKLSKHDRYWSEQFIIKINSRTKRLQTYIQNIYSNNTIKPQ